MEVRSFNFSKVGNRPEETEDAFGINIGLSKFAIADGASDSIFSGQWAASLANNFVNDKILFNRDEEIIDFIKNSRKDWYSRINWKDLKWNVKNKAIKGAYSTFLGLNLGNGPESDSTGYAIGDSCLFVINEADMISFPLSSSKEFGIHPDLVWSGYGFPLNNKSFEPKVSMKTTTFRATKGTNVILATDAMSKYIMDVGDESFPVLWDNCQDREFFDRRRSDKSIKNDDVSAILISF